MSAGVPDFVIAAAKNAESELIPAKSKRQYEKTYSDFCDWKKLHQIEMNSEDVLLAYFYELSQKYKPSSLWAYFSMIKSMLKVNENIDIATYFKLNAFLTNKSSGHKPVQAKVLTDKDLEQFIKTAGDKEWLDVKVACVFALSGTMRTDELYKVKLQDIEKRGDLFLVDIPETKTKKSRNFVITGAFFEVVDRYMSLRRRETLDPRFFVNYRDGRCTIQPIGKNKMYKMPERIATFLLLPEAKRYTGHSFRRSSASVLANAGASKDRIMRAGGWKSDKIAETYIEASMTYKRKTGDMITSSIMSNEGCASQGYTEHIKDDDMDVLIKELPYISETKGVGSGKLEGELNEIDVLRESNEIDPLQDSGSSKKRIRMQSEITSEGKENDINSLELETNLSKTFSFSNCDIKIYMK